MKEHSRIRKGLAGALCLVLLAGMVTVPALAAPDDAPAASVEAPAAKSDAPAASAESSSSKSDAPAKAETPAAGDTSAKSETPAAGDTSAKSETPAASDTSTKSETPAASDASAKSETPAAGDTSAKSETPAASDTSAKSETPAAGDTSAKSETPAADDTSAKSETPAADSDDAPAADEAPAENDAPAEDSDDAPAVVAPAPSRAPVRPVPLPSRAPAADDREETPAADEADQPAPEEEIAPIALDEGDGFEVDWDRVGTQPGGDWQATRWGLARGNGGYYVYLENTQNQVSIGITYYHSASDAIRYRGWIAGGRSLLGENEAPIKDSTLTVINEGGNYRMEGFIPDSFFKETSFILSSGSVTLASEDIPRLSDATEPELSDDVSAATGKEVDPSTKAGAIGADYTGIVIDGDFSDWDAVPLHDMKDTYDAWGNVKNYDTVDQAAVVWDGEWIYLLLVAEGDRDWQGNLTGSGNWNSVCGAGPNNNGQYAIVTDLNQQLLVQPAVVNGQPAVNGIDGAQVAVNNTEWFGAPHMWEIAIPAQELPAYLESFDFGLYLVEPSISGVTDLQGGQEGDTSFQGVVLDGKFDDWTYYPMTTIQYATAGTQDHVRDAHGALWADGTTLYGYVATDMLAHLGAHGGEFLGDIALSFTGDRGYKSVPTDGNFYPRILALDDLDRITPNSPEYTADGGAYLTLTAGYELEDGDYTFYIFDTRTAPAAPVYDPETNTTYYPTVADLRDQAFGTIKIHVDGGLDQAEFALDLEKVAAYIDKDADTAFRVVEIQWGRLGQQWISYAGTPTGPIISVALLVGAVGIPMFCVERKRRKAAGEEPHGDTAK